MGKHWTFVARRCCCGCGGSEGRGGGSGGKGGGGIAGGHGAIMLVEPVKKNAPPIWFEAQSIGLPLCKVKWTWLVDKNSRVTVNLRWIAVSASGSLGLSEEEEAYASVLATQMPSLPPSFPLVTARYVLSSSVYPLYPVTKNE